MQGDGVCAASPRLLCGSQAGLVKSVASALGSVGWKHLLGTVRSCLCEDCPLQRSCTRTFPQFKFFYSKSSAKL